VRKPAFASHFFRRDKKQKKKKTGGPTEAPKEEEAGPFAGIRSAWNKMYKEADDMGYAQAVSHYSRGVLKMLARWL